MATVAFWKVRDDDDEESKVLCDVARRLAMRSNDDAPDMIYCNYDYDDDISSVDIVYKLSILKNLDQ